MINFLQVTLFVSIWKNELGNNNFECLTKTFLLYLYKKYSLPTEF